jgi:hypothetical protein
MRPNGFFSCNDNKPVFPPDASTSWNTPDPSIYLSFLCPKTKKGELREKSPFPLNIA